jgi:hypothetical protein
LTRMAKRRALGGAAVLCGLAIAAGLLVAETGAATRTRVRSLSFSGYTWDVKSSAGQVGPGPNYFSDGNENVWVDPTGRLHLKITSANGRWYCAEVVNQESLGRGVYAWTLESPVDRFDPNVVLGLFTWNDEPTNNHRELDVEFARWGDGADPTNGQFVVQPYDHLGALLRITQPAGVASSRHGFTWGATSVEFSSSSAAPRTWSYRGNDVPQPGGEHVRMNLWLFGGATPTDGQEIEVVISRFDFRPGN